MSEEELYINGELLRLGREAKGWVLNDMATRACMSVKQIRQLEEGGTSSFYSVAVKATAAKKVANLLGVSVDDVFGRVAPVEEPETLDAPQAHDELHLSASEDGHKSSAPSEQQHSSTPVEVLPEIEPEPVALVEPAHDHNASQEELAKEKNKTSLWAIAALFAAALAVAAYMRPQEEPAAEAAPPLQVVPSDAADAASAPEGAASAASAAETSVQAPQVQKPASSPTAVASTSTSAASVPRVVTANPVTPAASAAVLAPASAPATKAP